MKLFSLTSTLLVIGATSAVDWNYQDDQGADWPTDFPDECAGSFQSPIDIDPDAADVSFIPPPLVFSPGWYRPNAGLMKNNGHTLQVDLSTSTVMCGDTTVEDLPTVTGGILGDKVFQAIQFHFHWGNDSTRGSEHLLDGVQYPASVHIVTYDTSLPDVGTALTTAGGLAVLGYVFELGSNTYNTRFISDRSVRNIVDCYEKTVPVEITLSDFTAAVPSTEYYYYPGSLTTPNCYESVLWHVFKTPLTIREKTLETLRSLVDSDGYLMGDNYRADQPLGDRTVISFTSVDACPSDD